MQSVFDMGGGGVGGGGGRLSLTSSLQSGRVKAAGVCGG